MGNLPARGGPGLGTAFWFVASTTNIVICCRGWQLDVYLLLYIGLLLFGWTDPEYDWQTVPVSIQTCTRIYLSTPITVITDDPMIPMWPLPFVTSFMSPTNPRTHTHTHPTTA